MTSMPEKLFKYSWHRKFKQASSLLKRLVISYFRYIFKVRNEKAFIQL